MHIQYLTAKDPNTWKPLWKIITHVILYGPHTVKTKTQTKL